MKVEAGGKLCSMYMSFVHMCLMYVMFIEHLTARVTAINACTVVRGSAAHLSGQSAGGTDDQSART